MKMGTAGIGVGIGAHAYQVVFLFEDEPTFRQFVDKGWEAETQANAAAGTAGANVASSFTQGLAFYQITEAGLIASADIAGTKYWKSKKLNP
jgi:lipid-binding SYLF domain-containing protein